jgi:hypothetical protein
MKGKVIALGIVFLILAAFCQFYLSCEGPKGPAGPTGSEGPRGPSGAGTKGYLARFVTDSTISNSSMFQDSATGNIGIGTIIPIAKLDVAGTAKTEDLTASRLYLDNSNADGARIVWRGGANGEQEYRARVFTNGALWFWPTNSDDQQVPGATLKLQLDGWILAEGNLRADQLWCGQTEQCASDLRWKENIKVLSNSLEKINLLRGVSFDWKKDSPQYGSGDKGKQLGLIAQEVKEIFPEVVSQDKGGYYYVSYDGLIPVLIEGLKEQQKTIEGQAISIQDLKQQLAKVDALEARLAKLESLQQDQDSEHAELSPGGGGK